MGRWDCWDLWDVRESEEKWVWFVGKREREGQVLVLELRFMPCEAGTEPWRIVARARRLEALGPCVHGYVTQLHGTARQRVCRSGTQPKRFLSQSRPSTYPMLHLPLPLYAKYKKPSHPSTNRRTNQSCRCYSRVSFQSSQSRDSDRTRSLIGGKSPCAASPAPPRHTLARRCWTRSPIRSWTLQSCRP